MLMNRPRVGGFLLLLLVSKLRVSLEHDCARNLGPAIVEQAYWK